MSSFTRICLSVLALNFLGCEASDKRSTHGAPSLEEAIGAFYSANAKYEIIESGELIEFDFVQSCYNKEMVGSFAGVLSPPNLFKATQEGHAIAIRMPIHFCQNLLRGHKLERTRTLGIDLPLLAWYDDVNDLSSALIYMTNDAYLGPKAKVRLIEFTVEDSTREAFYKWVEKAKSDYKQVGAIPGPLGCTLEQPGGSCYSDETMSRNQNKPIAPPVYEGAAWVRNLPGLREEFGKLISTKNDYDCTGGYIPGSDEPVGRENGPKRIREMAFRSQEDSDESMSGEISQANSLLTESLRASEPGSALLDRESLLSNSEQKIAEIYPVKIFSFEKSDLNQKEKKLVQVLYAPEWKGFALFPMRIYEGQDNKFAEVKGLLSSYQGGRHSLLFFNEYPACAYDQHNNLEAPGHVIYVYANEKSFQFKRSY